MSAASRRGAEFESSRTVPRMNWYSGFLEDVADAAEHLGGGQVGMFPSGRGCRRGYRRNYGARRWRWGAAGAVRTSAGEARVDLPAPLGPSTR